MPCYDSRNDPDNVRKESQYEIDTLKRRNDELARMLCGLCTELHRAGTESKMYPHGYIRYVPGLEAWWKEHQEFDRKRLKKKK